MTKYQFNSVCMALSFLMFFACSTSTPDKPSPIPEKEIDEHKATAKIELPDGVGKDLVISNCVHCHSSKLIAQNKATREGWLAMIRWMQKTQGLWPLGGSEEAILDYLTSNFSPENQGRRAPLTDIQWYQLGEL